MQQQSFRAYLTAKFGGPVLKVPVQAGFSCPNRDGTKGEQGCLFCDNRSFSPAVLDPCDAVEKMRATIAAAGARYRFFIPYLQPFSNTYAPLEQLSNIYEPLVALPGVVGLAIGTRPDCFAPGVFSYLEELNQRTFLIVELGLQSAHDNTLQLLARGHTASEFAHAINELRSRGIYTVAHVMLGLPGESAAQMAQTGEFLANLGVDGVKIHQTMVIRGTALEQLYDTGAYRVLDLPEYAQLVALFVNQLKPSQHIHRLCAQSTIENGLVAPLWSLNKGAALKDINSLLR